MAKLVLSDEAADALDALLDKDDPMAERIEDGLDVIAANPYDLRVRRRQLTRPTRYIYIVYGPRGGEDWVILWHPEPDDDAMIAVVDYLGIDIFS
jgi:hypothetical protein